MGQARSHCRIQLVDTRRMKPIDGGWKPTVQLWEVVEANERMAQYSPTWRWRIVKEDLTLA